MTNKTRDELLAALKLEGHNHQVACMKFEGMRKLFDAASMSGDGPGAEDYRRELHTLLDAMLDSSSVQQSLSRSILLADH